MLSPETDLQLRILHTFTSLHQLRSNWPGALILNLGLDPAGEALSFAANIAGAVCLSLESDPALLRNAQRTGSCDFLVNSLDEALRAMKNEIRKHRPLSVALAADPTPTLSEIVARGLSPALFTAGASHPEATSHFQSLGAQLFAFTKNPSSTDSQTTTVPLENFVEANPWTLKTFRFTTAAELHDFDTHALAQLSTDPANILRRQWLLTIARILPRDRHRTLWLTTEENAILES